MEEVILKQSTQADGSHQNVHGRLNLAYVAAMSANRSRKVAFYCECVQVKTVSVDCTSVEALLLVSNFLIGQM
jgi:hypothetical protein